MNNSMLKRGVVLFLVVLVILSFTLFVSAIGSSSDDDGGIQDSDSSTPSSTQPTNSQPSNNPYFRSYVSYMCDANGCYEGISNVHLDVNGNVEGFSRGKRVEAFGGTIVLEDVKNYLIKGEEFSFSKAQKVTLTRNGNSMSFTNLHNININDNSLTFKSKGQEYEIPNPFSEQTTHYKINKLDTDSDGIITLQNALGVTLNTDGTIKSFDYAEKTESQQVICLIIYELIYTLKA